MKLRSKRKQAGLTLTGLVFLLVLVGLVAVVAIRVVPTVTEYMAIKKAVTSARQAGSTPQEIRSAFDKQAEVGYIQSVSGKDLEISRNGEVTNVSFSYQKVIPLVGPASLLLDYEGSTANTKPGKAGTQ
jgi:type II secretory pathway pseudopilin PulG